MRKTVQLGKNIKLARIARGLTQAELADKIHKTRSLISHIEQTGKVHTETYHLILDVLEMGEDQLKKLDKSIGGSQSVSETMQEMEQLKSDLARMESENLMLRELIENQRRLIGFLEKK